ncbi:hypothetical protein CMEL01_01594 [Colletotrichum melonis]|uniref:Uncharacterized protein n=1 Tax=Colletotrichum melonis TaxID=1209925 RepID=A0AAI9Y3X1_9PEZI|nr:hypothetical protein CMEL01_01594 [Colletotrichum melonis]
MERAVRSQRCAVCEPVKCVQLPLPTQNHPFSSLGGVVGVCFAPPLFVSFSVCVVTLPPDVNLRIFSFLLHASSSQFSSLSPSRLHRRLDTCVTLLRSSTHH